MLVVGAKAVVADVLVAALGRAHAEVQLFVGSGPVVSEELLAGPEAAGEKSSSVAN